MELEVEVLNCCLTLRFEVVSKLKFNGMISDEIVDIKIVKPKNNKVVATKVKHRISLGSRDRKSELERMFEKIKKKNKLGLSWAKLSPSWCLG